MSRNRIQLSRAAEGDLLEIDDYTIEQFGVRQAAQLRELFRETLQKLLAVPNAAPLRRELDPPGHTFRYHAVLRTFVIVYEPSEHGIRVARILHGARDVAAALARDAGEDG